MFPLGPFSRFVPPNRRYVSIYELTDREGIYGKADLAPVSELEAIACESLLPRITVIRNLLREPRTNYPDYYMRVGCRYSPARLPETALRPRSYRPRAV